MIDHIIGHLELADAFAANAARIAALRCSSRQSHNVMRQCRQAAERERNEAASHLSDFQIDSLILRQERAAWQRLQRCSLDRVEALTMADKLWLRAVVRHGRAHSRNVRRAAELLLLTDGFSGDGRNDDPPSSLTEPGDITDARLDGSQNAGDVPP